MTTRILRGDCRALLPTLPAGSVHCCVTSPPYFGLRSYLPEGHPDKALEMGSEATPEEFVAALVKVFQEVKRVLRDDGTLWLNIGDSYNNNPSTSDIPRAEQGNGSGVFQIPGEHHVAARRAKANKATPLIHAGIKKKDLIGIPWLLAFALRADGWYLRSDIIWHKPNPMPESVRDRPTSAHEHVFLLSKRGAYFYDADAVREDNADTSWASQARIDGRTEEQGPKAKERKAYELQGSHRNPDGRNARNVWTIATQPFSGAHFATMAPQLAERCILAGTSERGACPACGAPWRRLVERELVPTAKVSYGSRPDARDAVADAKDQGSNRMRDGHVPGMATRNTTTGWAPTCSCPVDQAPVPCVVLDPFGGAGTTGMVADRLQRDAVLIELNPESIDLAAGRVSGDAPLLAKVI